MKNKKILSILLSLMIAISMFFGGCGTKDTSGGKNNVSDKGPYGKYDPPISVTSCRILTSWMAYDDGEDMNNNVWTKAYLDNLGIKLTQAWTAPNWGTPFDEKVNIGISSDSLPDIMPIYTTLFYRISQSGKAADLTQLLEKYGSDDLKTILKSNNGIYLKASSYNGKLYGLPQVPNTTSRSLLYIRKDWLDKLGLKAPKTLDDVLELAKQFKERDAGGTGKTIGFAMSKDFFSGDNSIKDFFAAHGLYNGWVLKDGKLVKGETLPENKEVLNKLAKMYKDGIIPKDFVLKDPVKDSVSDVVSGKVGIIFNAWNWMGSPAVEDLHKNDPKAEWIAMPIPTTTGKPYKEYITTSIGNFFVANAKCKNPEALIKMANLQVEIDKFNPKYVKDNSFNMSSTGKMNFWNKILDISDPLKDKNEYEAVSNALKTKDISKLNFSEKYTYDKVINTDATQLDWGYGEIYKKDGPADIAFSKELQNNYILSPAWGPETQAWIDNGQDLSSKENELFIQAVMTGDVDKYFDQWTQYFNKQGGAEATKEINDWYAKNK